MTSTAALGGSAPARDVLRSPPEQLLSALLLQVFYGIRSERQFIEQLDYNLSYAGSWDFRRTIQSGTRPASPRTGSGCRTAMWCTKFTTRLPNHPQVKSLLSDEHFSRWSDRAILVDKTVGLPHPCRYRRKAARHDAVSSALNRHPLKGI